MTDNLKKEELDLSWKEQDSNEPMSETHHADGSVRQSKLETSNPSFLEKLSWIAGIASTILGFYIFVISSPETSKEFSKSVSDTHSREITEKSGKALGIAKTYPKLKVIRKNLEKLVSKKHRVSYPYVEDGIENDSIQSVVNHTLKRYVLTFYEKYNYADDLSIDYLVGFQEFGLMAVTFSVDFYKSGAAHGQSTSRTIVIDSDNGSEVLLKDLLIGDFTSELNSIVVKKLKDLSYYFPCEKSLDREEAEASKMINDVLSDILDHPSPACFKEINADNQFYLDDTSLVLVFPKYQITPGYVGNLEIPLSYFEIRSIINVNSALGRYLLKTKS